MSAIDVFRSHQADLRRAEQWAALLGSEYRGGGGGVGHITSLTVRADIYHQASDGANNYHAIDKGMGFALASVIKAHGAELIAEALEFLRAENKVLAQKAAEEHAEFLKAAGLSVPLT